MAVAPQETGRTPGTLVWEKHRAGSLQAGLPSPGLLLPSRGGFVTCGVPALGATECGVCSAWSCSFQRALRLAQEEGWLQHDRFSMVSVRLCGVCILLVFAMHLEGGDLAHFLFIAQHIAGSQ